MNTDVTNTAGDVRSLNLTVGEQGSIPAAGVKSYSEGIPGIVDVRLPRDGSQFLIVALKPGRTTLLLIMNDGKQVQYRISVATSGAGRGEVVQPTDNIRLDFYYVQLSESYGHQIGLGWPGTIGGSLNISAGINLKSGSLQSATATLGERVLPRLDMAQSAGWAKVMKQASVITANGNDASFESGGEVNLPIQGALTAEIRRIEFGSNLSVLPRYDRQSGRIELTLKAEVSDLTAPSGDSKIPGRSKSNLQTLVNIELGQSLILAGLSSRAETYAKSGLPGLSQIPIFGLLFGTNIKNEEHVENLIFVVPTVVDVVSQQSRDRLAEAMKMYEDYSGGLDDVEVMDHKPPKRGVPMLPGATPTYQQSKRR